MYMYMYIEPLLQASKQQHGMSKVWCQELMPQGVTGPFQTPSTSIHVSIFEILRLLQHEKLLLATDSVSFGTEIDLRKGATGENVLHENGGTVPRRAQSLSKSPLQVISPEKVEPLVSSG